MAGAERLSVEGKAGGEEGNRKADDEASVGTLGFTLNEEKGPRRDMNRVLTSSGLDCQRLHLHTVKGTQR